jgi:Asp-tRNA(Asn)/Glu-tRNA(Gln) amidotransferase A subunit family amidase
VDLSGRRAIWSELGYPRAHEETYQLAKAAAEAAVEHAGVALDSSSWAPPEPIEPSLSTDASAVDFWMMVDREIWEHRRAELGEDAITYVGSAVRGTVPTLADVHRARIRIAGSVADLFRTHDFLLTPSTSIPAFDVEQSLEIESFEGAPLPFGPDPQHHLASLCGNPAISVPAGVTTEGLPVGLQIVGRRHHDLEVLALAHALERARPWPRLPPAGARATT